jgi:hypothetical protein
VPGGGLEPAEESPMSSRRATAVAPWAVFVLLSLALSARAVDVVTVTPKETDELLANPGMGWQTFFQFADRDKALAGLPSACAYFRFYWVEVEKEEGKIDFAKLDDLLARAHTAGQKMALRIMCAGGPTASAVPDYLKAQGCKGYEYQEGGKGRVKWVPDFDDPIFVKNHTRLIRALGEHLDGHADFDEIDIGSVGLWGEWHMSGTKVAMPSRATCDAIIDLYAAAFPKSPKCMLIGDADGMRHAFTLGAGWRADCIGDLGGFSKNWNHMENLYPQQLEKAGAKDVWKTAPVAYESCWDMRKWKEQGWDVRRIFDFALETHASYLNNKSAPLPEGVRPEVERFLRKLGYRLVLRKLSHPAEVAAGGRLELASTWANVGVAPPYRDYRVAVCLPDAKGGRRVLVSEQSVKGFLPGEREMPLVVSLPKDLAAGKYAVSVGIVPPGVEKPAIKLAIEGRDGEGWYPVSAVTVK